MSVLNHRLKPARKPPARNARSSGGRGPTTETMKGSQATLPQWEAKQPDLPNFDALDAEGIERDGALNEEFASSNRTTDQNYLDTVGRLNAARRMAGQGRDDGYRGADSNAAGRGMFNSGIRSQNRTRVAGDYEAAMANYTQDEQRALSDWGTARTTAARNFRLGGLTNRTESANRLRERYMENNVEPMASRQAGPVPVTKITPSKTYKDFLAGRKSTSALAKRWNTSYNFGQNRGLL